MHHPYLFVRKANKRRKGPVVDTMATADSEDVSDSESGRGWGTDWEEIYIEGLKMVKTAAPYQCLETGARGLFAFVE